MSITALRPYLRARFESQGFTEWKDGFNADNIPSTQLNKAFHLGPVSGTLDEPDQSSIRLSGDMEVRFFVKGFRDVSSGIDSATEYVENMIIDILKAVNRLSIEGIQSVNVESWNMEQLADSNDNAIVVTLSISSLITLCI